jgi:hypothetical protein
MQTIAFGLAGTALATLVLVAASVAPAAAFDAKSFYEQQARQSGGK